MINCCYMGYFTVIVMKYRYTVLGDDTVPWYKADFYRPNYSWRLCRIDYSYIISHTAISLSVWCIGEVYCSYCVLSMSSRLQGVWDLAGGEIKMRMISWSILVDIYVVFCQLAFLLKPCLPDWAIVLLEYMHWFNWYILLLIISCGSNHWYIIL